MPDEFNKFNSKSGFELNIDNVLSKIRLDFDTNVEKPDNYILGVNSEQTEFVLIDPNYLNNTESLENTLDLASMDGGMVGKVKHYTFEKTVDPSVVGCSNCDSTTDVYSFANTGDIPLINRQVIAEFEVNPDAVHSFEIELVGHRTICDDSGNCFNSWSDKKYPAVPLLSTDNSVITIMPDQHRNGLFTFIDYSCCPCCDANQYYTEKYINNQLTSQEMYDKIIEVCNKSNNYIEVDGVIIENFSQYCTKVNIPFYDEIKNIQELTSHCILINRTKTNYGPGIDTSLLTCSTYTPEMGVL